MLARGKIERGGDCGAIHGVDNQGLRAFLDQGVDIRDLLGRVVAGYSGPIKVALYWDANFVSYEM